MNAIGAIHPQKSRPIATYLLENAVRRNGLPDHRAEILGLEAGQVNEGKEVGGYSTREMSGAPGFPNPGDGKIVRVSLSGDFTQNPQRGGS